MTTLSNKKLRAIAEAATPGGWRVGAEHTVWREPYRDEKGRRVSQPLLDAGIPAALSAEEKAANATFIATFDPEQVKKLLDRIEELEGVLRDTYARALEGDLQTAPIGKEGRNALWVALGCPNRKALEQVDD